MSYKTLQKLLPSVREHWVGDGFRVQPVFADLAFTNEISPFLMFDYAAPKHFEPTKSKLGVGQHPHRGFETVTIALQGEVEHGDSVGNRPASMHSPQFHANILQPSSFNPSVLTSIPCPRVWIPFREPNLLAHIVSPSCANGRGDAGRMIE